MIDPHHGWNPSLKPQVLGYVVSILLLFAAFFVVEKHQLTDGDLKMAIAGFAVAQALVQLFFFLHLGMESKPHWNTITFIFAVIVILIIIGGSLWIMHNLNYDLMPPMGHE
jgi:cytochrome o ubiquinol oxidase operon protein cyoD